MHAAISGGGLTNDRQLKLLHADSFFILENVMAAKFRRKFLDGLEKAWRCKELVLTGDAAKLRNSYEWNEFRDSLYKKKWVVHVKETFNGKGNAIEYLGRYAHKIAISDSRIRSVSENKVLFTARGGWHAVANIFPYPKRIRPVFPASHTSTELPEDPLLWVPEQLLKKE